MPAWKAVEAMQGLWWQQRMPAWKGEEQLQGLRRRQHMPAFKAEEQLQGLRGRQHLPARKGEEQMQGLRGRQHLPAWKAEEQLQGLQERRHFRSKRRIKTSGGQQRMQRSVFQGDCGRGACGRQRRERECKKEGGYAGGGMWCARALLMSKRHAAGAGATATTRFSVALNGRPVAHSYTSGEQRHAEMRACPRALRLRAGSAAECCTHCRKPPLLTQMQLCFTP